MKASPEEASLAIQKNPIVVDHVNQADPNLLGIL